MARYEGICPLCHSPAYCDDGGPWVCTSETCKARAMSPEWISVAVGLPKNKTKVTAFIEIYASPRSMGMADEFEEPDVWREGKKWFHMYKGEPTEIYSDYVTYWKPVVASQSD